MLLIKSIRWLAPLINSNIFPILLTNPYLIGVVGSFYLTVTFFSGMLVQDPSKGNDVDAIFDQARQLGAVQGPLENLQPSNSRSFTGTGRLLSGETVPNASQQPESVVHNIVFWINGFTVNDGPLRRLDDPENAPFLEVIYNVKIEGFN